jgi:hypothetical protein
MSNTTYASQQLMRLNFSVAALSARPTQWFVGVHTGDPGVSGSNNEVTVGTDANYARKAVTWAETEEGGITFMRNSADIAFNALAAGASYTLQHATIWSALTGGACLAILPLASPRAFTAGGVARFSIGELVLEGNSNDN